MGGSSDPIWLQSFRVRRRKLVIWALLHIYDLISDIFMLLSLYWEGQTVGFALSLTILIVSRLATTSVLVGRSLQSWTRSPTRTALVFFDLYPVPEAFRLFRRPRSPADALDATTPAFANPNVFFLEATLESLPQTLLQTYLAILPVTSSACLALSSEGVPLPAGAKSNSLLSFIPPALLSPHPVVPLLFSLLVSSALVALTLTELETSDARGRAVVDISRLRRGLADVHSLTLVTFRTFEAAGRALSLGLLLALVATAVPAGAAAVRIAVPHLPVSARDWDLPRWAGLTAGSGGCSVWSGTWVRGLADRMVSLVDSLTGTWEISAPVTAMIVAVIIVLVNVAALLGWAANTVPQPEPSSPEPTNCPLRSKGGLLSTPAPISGPMGAPRAPPDLSSVRCSSSTASVHERSPMRLWMVAVFFVVYWERRHAFFGPNRALSLVSAVSAPRYYAFRAAEVSITLWVVFHLISRVASSSEAADVAGAASCGALLLDVDLGLVWINTTSLARSITSAASATMHHPLSTLWSLYATLPVAPAAVGRLALSATQVVHSVLLKCFLSTPSVSTLIYLWISSLALSFLPIVSVMFLLRIFQWGAPAALAPAAVRATLASSETADRKAKADLGRSLVASSLTTPQRHLVSFVAPAAVLRAQAINRSRSRSGAGERVSLVPPFSSTQRSSTRFDSTRVDSELPVPIGSRFSSGVLPSSATDAVDSEIEELDLDDSISFEPTLSHASSSEGSGDGTTELPSPLLPGSSSLLQSEDKHVPLPHRRRSARLIASK